MRPRTKIQHRIVALSDTIPKLTGEQEEFGHSVMDAFVVKSRNKWYCLECNHSWKTARTPKKCQGCSARLTEIRKNAVHFSEMDYFAILDTIDEFQVVRVVAVIKHMKKNVKPYFFCSEVMQHFIDPKGDVTVMARQVNGMSYYNDQWIYSTPRTVQAKHYTQHVRFGVSCAKVYPVRRVTPMLRQYGLKGALNRISPSVVARALLKANSYVETLLKTRQISALKHQLNQGYDVSRYWSSIRICIRNRYTIKDFGIWKDYLELLKYFRKDLHSPKYVCPKNLKLTHDRLVRKKRDIQRKEREDKLRAKIAESQAQYEEMKKHFFGLKFKDKDLVVSVIETVNDFMKEGDTLNHCVFTNEYYSKKDSLVLSARIRDRIIETVEVNLKTMKIVQSRGKDNKATEHNAWIVNLVTRNLKAIKQLNEQSKSISVLN